MTPLQKRPLSGAQSVERTRETGITAADTYFPTDEEGCPGIFGNNIRVNQDRQNLSDPDLAGRAEVQNETFIAQDPMRPNRMLAAAHSYIQGDVDCTAFPTTDPKAERWQDVVVPTGFTRGQPTFGSDRQYWQVGGDPGSRLGHARQRLLRLPAVQPRRPADPRTRRLRRHLRLPVDWNGGASWNFPGRVVTEREDLNGSFDAARPDSSSSPSTTIPAARSAIGST